MTGHDLDPDARAAEHYESVGSNHRCRICNEWSPCTVEALRAKLAAAEQERDHWVAWCSVQARALAAVVGMGDWVGPGRILAAAEQDEPTGCLSDCGWTHCRPPCPQASQPAPTTEQP